MKHIILFLLSVTFASAGTLEDIAAYLKQQRATRSPVAEFVPTPAPYPVTEPSAVYSSVSAGSIAKVPVVLKAGHPAVGLLKWTAAQDRPGDPVVGYEVQRDSGDHVNLVYTVTITEFPFVSGMDGMINVAAFEFWKVRAVFQSGARSAWAVSQTFPERVTLNY